MAPTLLWNLYRTHSQTQALRVTVNATNEAQWTVLPTRSRCTSHYWPALSGYLLIESITASKEQQNENGEWRIHPLRKRLKEV